MAEQSILGRACSETSAPLAPFSPLDSALIMYQVGDRAFGRVFHFHESTIGDMKRVIRGRLSLDSKVNLKLAHQWRGQWYELKNAIDLGVLRHRAREEWMLAVKASITPLPAPASSKSGPTEVQLVGPSLAIAEHPMVIATLDLMEGLNDIYHQIADL
ncbi:hypothetical protein BDV93DRAFT_596483 [Ceratobasidium sp. AG-I]|nr:hypothetical protein BDV93DRAFT_596483 [Ceratobasidium sp. AG-I]